MNRFSQLFLNIFWGFFFFLATKALSAWITTLFVLPMSEAVSSQNKLGEASEAEEDDMAHGDLGNGLIRRPSYIYEIETFSSHAGRPRRGSTRKSFSLVMLPSKGEECDTAVFRCSRCNSSNDMSVKKIGINGFSRCSRQNSSGKTSGESKAYSVLHS